MSSKRLLTSAFGSALLLAALAGCGGGGGGDSGVVATNPTDPGTTPGTNPPASAPPPQNTGGTPTNGNNTFVGQLQGLIDTDNRWSEPVSLEGYNATVEPDQEPRAVR